MEPVRKVVIKAGGTFYFHRRSQDKPKPGEATGQSQETSRADFGCGSCGL